jgi:hypothetical protein
VAVNGCEIGDFNLPWLVARSPGWKLGLPVRFFLYAIF